MPRNETKELIGHNVDENGDLQRGFLKETQLTWWERYFARLASVCALDVYVTAFGRIGAQNAQYIFGKRSEKVSVWQMLTSSLQATDEDFSTRPSSVTSTQHSHSLSLTGVRRRRLCFCVICGIQGECLYCCQLCDWNICGHCFDLESRPASVLSCKHEHMLTRVGVSRIVDYYCNICQVRCNGVYFCEQCDWDICGRCFDRETPPLALQSGRQDEAFEIIWEEKCKSDMPSLYRLFWHVYKIQNKIFFNDPRGT